MQTEANTHDENFKSAVQGRNRLQTDKTSKVRQKLSLDICKLQNNYIVSCTHLRCVPIQREQRCG